MLLFLSFFRLITTGAERGTFLINLNISLAQFNTAIIAVSTTSRRLDRLNIMDKVAAPSLQILLAYVRVEVGDWHLYQIHLEYFVYISAARSYQCCLGSTTFLFRE